MKSLIFLASLISPQIMAQALDEPIEGMVQGDSDTLPPVQTERFNALLNEIKTGDYFAGRTAIVSFQGKTWKIDRSMEAVKMKTPGNPPSRLEPRRSFKGPRSRCAGFVSYRCAAGIQ